MNDELSAYEQEAEDTFDDYQDNYNARFYEEDDFDTGLDGLEEDDSHEGEYDDYKASSIGSIDPNDRTLTIVIKNESGSTSEAILFGANASEPQPAGVSVEVSESSHQEVRNETFANPFVIKGVKMSVSNPLQFDQVININRRTATGSNEAKVWQPRNSTSPQNLSQNLIDDSQFTAEITPRDSIRFKILDGVTIVFTFTIKARVNMGNLLKGKNVAELSTTPRTTGLPQLDLMQKKRNRSSGKRVRRVYRKNPNYHNRRNRNQSRNRRTYLKRR